MNKEQLLTLVDKTITNNQDNGTVDPVVLEKLASFDANHYCDVESVICPVSIIERLSCFRNRIIDTEHCEFIQAAKSGVKVALTFAILIGQCFPDAPIVLPSAQSLVDAVNAATL